MRGQKQINLWESGESGFGFDDRYDYDDQILLFLVYFNNQMSIRKLVGMDEGIQDLQFQLRPQIFYLDKPNKSFVLYLEKGMQILGRFQASLASNNKLAYRFKSVEPAVFRLNSHSTTCYQWTMYSSDMDNRQEVLQDSVHFDIMDHIKLYQFQMGEKEREIQLSYKEKNINRSIIYQTWNKIKNEIKSHRSKLKTVFKSHKYNLQFELIIKNSLDIAMELYQQNQGRNFTKKNYSDDLSKQKMNNSLSIDSQIKIDASDQAKAEGILKQKKNNNFILKQLVDRHQDQVRIQGQANVIAQNEQIVEEDLHETVVKIMNPTGQELSYEQKTQQSLIPPPMLSRDTKMLPMPDQPHKKVSLLSDIIERSYEGSSSYGRDISSQHHTNKNAFPYNIQDHTIIQHSRAELEAEQNFVQHRQRLNKFSTLPDKHPHQMNKHLKIEDEFRRAKTSEKHEVEVDNFHESSIIEDKIAKEIENELNMSKAKNKTSGDPYAKWIILICMLVVMLMVGNQLTPGVLKSPKARRKAVKADK